MSKAQPEFSIQKVYLKDLSFESPAAPAVFLKQWEPSVNVDFDIEHEALEDDSHNIMLTVTISTKMNDKVIFIAEAKQAGIFLIKNIPESDMEGILKGVCPNILFPYARQQLSQLIGDGGYPPLYLAPMNFEAMYLQQQAGTANEN